MKNKLLQQTFSRRTALNHLGAIGAISLLGCEEDTSSSSEAGTMTEAGTMNMMNRCLETPPQVEGPYYFALDENRVDMTGGREGAALIMNLMVTDQDCLPVPNALVEVWHADAQGVYSGFGGQAENTTGLDFLRGESITDNEGNVQFTSIYPGWYPGRAVHVHFKVSLADRTLVTSQFYLPDEMSRMVYQTGAYQNRGEQDTLVERDRFFQGAGSARELLLASVEENDSSYLARLQITI